MVQIIRSFEEKQQRSNILWLEGQVCTCEEPDTSEEVREERNNKLAKGLGYDSWISLVSRHNLTSPRDLLSTDVSQSDKGTRRPLSPGRQHALLEQLYRAINENYDHDAADYQAVDLPEDYGLLLSITDGLQDTDLRDSGVCGIDGIQDADAMKMTGNGDLSELPWASVYWKYGWNISTGFRLGLGNPSNQQWLTYYYCFRTEYPGVNSEEIEDHE